MTTKTDKPMPRTKHGFPIRFDIDRKDIDALMKGVNTLPKAMAKIRVTFKNRTNRNILKGDLLEYWHECCVLYEGMNPGAFGGGDMFSEGSVFRSSNIKPCKPGELGIDLYADADEGGLRVTQCKFLTDKNKILEDTNLQLRRVSEAAMNDKWQASHIDIFTTAADVSPEARRMLENTDGVQSVRVFGYEKLCKMLDGNTGFWKFMHEDMIARWEAHRDFSGEGLLEKDFRLRGYQAKASARCMLEIVRNDGIDHEVGAAKGRVVIPTGGGKTVIQADLLHKRIKQKEGTRVHVVIAPKVVLISQLIHEYRALIGDRNFRAISFNSGKEKSGLAMRTLKVAEVLAEIDNVRDNENDGRDIIVFSSYRSLGKLAKSGIKFDTLISDESHWCLSENAFDHIETIKARNKFFFTATERVAKDGVYRNNNVEAFGLRLFRVNPDSLIAKWYLVDPILHIVTGQRIDGSKSSFVDEVAHTALYQKWRLHPKMKQMLLVACDGQKEVNLANQHIDLLKEKLPNHKVFTITSKGSKIDGVPHNRESFMEELRASEGVRDVLIFHHDIFSEGVDISGISGCLIMRNMNQSKMLQTIGRAIRPYWADMENGEPRIGHLRIKRGALISVSIVDEDQGAEEIRDFLDNIIGNMIHGGFDLSKEKILVSDINQESNFDRVSADSEDCLRIAIELAQTAIEKVRHELKDAARRLAEEEESLGARDIARILLGKPVAVACEGESTAWDSDYADAA